MEQRDSKETPELFVPHKLLVSNVALIYIRLKVLNLFLTTDQLRKLCALFLHVRFFSLGLSRRNFFFEKVQMTGNKIL